MKPAARSELDELRYRAYGPSPDINDDPDALQRLADLENLSRQPASEDLPTILPVEESVPPAPDEPPAVSPDASEPVAPTPNAPEDPPLIPDAVSSSDHPRRRGISRIVWAAWGVSLVATAAIAAFATYGLVSIAPVAVTHGAEQIAALEPDSTMTVPVGWFGAGPSSATYSFYGLTLFETTSGMYGVGGDCFTVVLSSDLPAEGANLQNGYSTSGQVYSGCRVGNFPATVALLVDSSSPPELRAQFPDAALQFIKDGDRIGVFRGSVADSE